MYRYAIGMIAGACLCVLPSAPSLSRDVQSSANDPSTVSTLFVGKGLNSTIKVEKYETWQRAVFRDANGHEIPSGRILFHRLVVDNTLWGLQAVKLEKNAFDIFAAMSFHHPLENRARGQRRGLVRSAGRAVELLPPQRSRRCALPRTADCASGASTPRRGSPNWGSKSAASAATRCRVRGSSFTRPIRR